MFPHKSTLMPVLCLRLGLTAICHSLHVELTPVYIRLTLALIIALSQSSSDSVLVKQASNKTNCSSYKKNHHKSTKLLWSAQAICRGGHMPLWNKLGIDGEAQH